MRGLCSYRKKKIEKKMKWHIACNEFPILPGKPRLSPF
jgi:hypothetical protein